MQEKFEDIFKVEGRMLIPQAVRSSVGSVDEKVRTFLFFRECID